MVRYASATATSPTISTPLVTADIQHNITAKHNYIIGALLIRIKEIKEKYKALIG